MFHGQRLGAPKSSCNAPQGPNSIGEKSGENPDKPQFVRARIQTADHMKLMDFCQDFWWDFNKKNFLLNGAPDMSQLVWF